MDLDDVLALVRHSPVEQVEPGSAILREGERSSAIFVLISGELEVQRRGRAVVRIGEPGAMLGEIGLLLDQPANADVVAVGPVTVHRVDDSAGLFARYPELMGYLARMLARRLHQVSTYLSDLQEQFAGSSVTLGLVPTILQELLDADAGKFDTGSDREPDSPY